MPDLQALNQDDFADKVKIIKNSIVSIPDFPKRGIMFRDVSSLCANAIAFQYVIDLLCDVYAKEKIDAVASAEARGFIFGAALAYKLKCGFEMIRKPKRLPRETISESYDLEYGSNTLEITKDSNLQGKRVLLLDDLIATGGTAAAMVRLIKRQGGIPVAFAFVMELDDLGGVDFLMKEYGVKTFSLVKFPGH